MGRFLSAAGQGAHDNHDPDLPLEIAAIVMTAFGGVYAVYLAVSWIRRTCFQPQPPPAPPQQPQPPPPQQPQPAPPQQPQPAPVLRQIEMQEGLAASRLATLPLRVFSEELSVQIDEVECAICLGEYEVGEQLWKLPCRHHLHVVCLRAWFQKHATCPFCRVPV